MAQTLRGLSPIRGRPVPRHNYHITLAFLGNVEEDQLSCLCERAAEVSCTPFSLNFDQLGQFRRSGILWLGCSKTPEPLLQLNQALALALMPCGYQPEVRRFQPHVTLCRRFQGRLGDVEFRPIEWDVEGFHLVLSESTDEGVRYQSIATFPRSG
jgi:2'-5' RNA ligase